MLTIKQDEFIFDNHAQAPVNQSLPFPQTVNPVPVALIATDDRYLRTRQLSVSEQTYKQTICVRP
jgi:hypothetical protein